MAKFQLKSKLSSSEREQLIISFFESLACIKNSKESAQLLTDLLSPKELEMLAKRLAVARLLLTGRNYQQIGKKLKVSPATIARVNTWLQEAGEGFRLVIARSGPLEQQYGKDRVFAGSEGISNDFKRKYPQYFWPQLLLEKVINSANKKERQQLQVIIRRSKHKTQLLKRIDILLRKQ